MSNQIGKAGASTRQMAKKRWIRAFFILLTLFAFIIAMIAMISNQATVGLGFIGVFVLLVIMQLGIKYIERRMDKQMSEKERADRGAVGEETVGELLQTLPEGHLVLHDVPSPYGNIDHILLSRDRGVFLIETKAHYGKVEVKDGKLFLKGKPPEKNFISQTLQNTYWLGDQIESVVGFRPWVNGVIVFTKAFVPYGSEIKHVSLTNIRYLLSTLKKVTPSPDFQKLWEKRAEISKKLLSEIP
jgi:hypothetical protein